VSALVARTIRLVPRAVVAIPPRARLRLLVLLALVALLVGGWFLWFRDSSLVAIEKVEVTGLTAPESDRIEAALAAAAREMTTLNLDVDELERAVAGFPVVRSVQATPDFPHGLAIRVVERRPVALLVAGGRRVPVAGDGTVLPDTRVRGELPEIRASTATSGARLSDARALALTAMAGAAPQALRERVELIGLTDRRGIVARLVDGPEVVFGDARRARAKWIAAARVLAEPSAQGASYLDVRIPERPTAGGLDFDLRADDPPEPPPGTAPGTAQGTAPPPASGDAVPQG
jgi:cell division protein FtsQ